jgi:hypothetical protein
VEGVWSETSNAMVTARSPLVMRVDLQERGNPL